MTDLVLFDQFAKSDSKIEDLVKEFADKISTLEVLNSMPLIIFQDGAHSSYYIKCSMLASTAANFCDLDAKLSSDNPESFRANRELLLRNATYLQMATDAEAGREFNDIIAEYDTSYNAGKPLKIWGGQHRTKAISAAANKIDRYHGFRIYFGLNKDQRTDVALVSNTSISVSNDTFDRMLEETKFGDNLRKWCQLVGLLGSNEDFPDTGSKSDKITVKKARSFIVNFYLGKERSSNLKAGDLDKNVYEPHLAKTGTSIVDPEYQRVVKKNNILTDAALIHAGRSFVALHTAQTRAVTRYKSKFGNSKAFRNKAFVESVLCGWSYIAGLLQNHTQRLQNHYRLPKTTSKILDPLNAVEMSQYKHEQDPPTYRGLGTRSEMKDRQRIAQLFLARSNSPDVTIDKAFMNKAVNQVVGLNALSKGYMEA